MSINKLDNLTRRLNRAMRSILLNSEPNALTNLYIYKLGLTQTIKPHTWEALGILLRTDVTLHTEGVEETPPSKKYPDYFKYRAFTDSDKAYFAHRVDGDCICWGGSIECGATDKERKDILNFRKKECSQDWWLS